MRVRVSVFVNTKPNRSCWVDLLIPSFGTKLRDENTQLSGPLFVFTQRICVGPSAHLTVIPIALKKGFAFHPQ